MMHAATKQLGSHEIVGRIFNPAGPGRIENPAHDVDVVVGLGCQPHTQRELDRSRRCRLAQPGRRRNGV
jgi:hypothetical protein